jgi:hypothetical protein
MHPTADTKVVRLRQWIGAAGDAGRSAFQSRRCMNSYYVLGMLLLATSIMSGCGKDSGVEEQKLARIVFTARDVEESLGYLGSHAEAVDVSSLCLELKEEQSAANFPLSLRTRCIAAMLEFAEASGSEEWRNLAVEFGATDADIAKARKHREELEKEMENRAMAMSNMPAAPASQLDSLYPRPWYDTVKPEISRELSKWDIQGCGEYHFRRGARDRRDYLVHCTRDGKDWRAYLVWVGRYGGVAGPYAPTLH